MPELYNSLKSSITTESHVLDDLDRRTLQLFIDDFEQCGVHLEESKVKFIHIFHFGKQNDQTLIFYRMLHIVSFESMDLQTN